MTLLLIGLTDVPTAAALAAAGTLPDHVATPVAGLSAILIPQRRRALPPGKRHELADMLDVQRAMEAVLARGPLLPARPGICLRAIEDTQILDDSALILQEAFATSGGLQQYQITVSWDAQATLAALASRGALGALGGEDLGPAVRGRMAEEKVRMAALIRDALAPVARDLIGLASMDADVVADMVALVAPGADLDAALEAIDGLLPGNGRVRCVGPLPPVSFAAIALEHVDDAMVTAAQRLLGIAGEMTTRTLRQAFVSASRRNHPDTGGDGDLDATKQAYRLLSAVSGRASGRALVRIVRDGDVVRRAAA